MDEDAGRISLGISCTVRINLRDGTFHEDIGYGSSDNQRSKAAAFEKAKKEAVTDGIKRALRYFGNCLGNCTYDKSFLKTIRTMSIPQRNPISEDQFLKPNRSLDRSKSEGIAIQKMTTIVSESKDSYSDTDVFNENEEILNHMFDEAFMEEATGLPQQPSFLIKPRQNSSHPTIRPNQNSESSRMPFVYARPQN